MSAEEAKKSRSRKFIAIGCAGCLVVLVAAGLLGWALYGAYQGEVGRQVAGYETLLLPKVEAEACRVELQSALTGVIQLAEQKKLGLMTFGLLEQQVQAAMLDDVVSDAECDTLKALLQDIIASGGSVKLRDYARPR